MTKKYYRVEGRVNDWLTCYYDYPQEKYSQFEAVADFIYSVADDFSYKVRNINVTEVSEEIED